MGRGPWRNELAQYHAAQAVVIPEGDVIDRYFRGGRELGTQNPRRLKRILRRLRKTGALKLVRYKQSRTYGWTSYQFLTPHVRNRPKAKSLRKEKRGRHV